MSKGKRKTAGELMAELEKDPAFLERRRRQEEELNRRREEYRRAETPLRNALHAAGSQVSSVWDLVNTSNPYPELVPLLLDHLDRPYSDEVREGIARALAVREARIGWDKLVNLYLSEPAGGASHVKWALHLAIATAADVSVLDTLINLAVDRRHGRDRAFFVDALTRIKDPRATAALAKLRNDPDLAHDFERVTKKRR